MTSLSEAYHGGERGPDLRRLYLGVGLFLAGVLLVVGGIVAAASDLLLGSLTLAQARELGGVLGGVGVPAVMLGVLTVLPSNRRTRLAAVAGAAVSLLGVGLFVAAYPCQWVGATCGAGLPDRTLSTVVVYFAGTITTFWCLFVGVATFKTRNDPGGTARLNVTRQGETKVVEIERGGGVGGVGLFGSTPDGDVATQTNLDGGAGSSGPATAATSGPSANPAGTTDGAGGGKAGSAVHGGDSPTDASAGSPPDASAGFPPDAPAASSPNTPGGTPSAGTPEPSHASDGGAAADSIRSPLDDPGPGRDADVIDGEDGDVADRYCGNCAQFEYVRTDDGIRPYCHVTEELMGDMTACEEWEPRGR